MRNRNDSSIPSSNSIHTSQTATDDSTNEGRIDIECEISTTTLIQVQTSQTGRDIIEANSGTFRRLTHSFFLPSIREVSDCTLLHIIQIVQRYKTV
jgi:hypothetical protein